MVDTMGAYAWRLVGIAAVVVGIVWLFGQLRVVVVPVLIAAIITRVLEPVASRLRARGLGPGLAAATALVLLLGSIALVGWLIGPSVADEFADLGPTLTDAVDDIETWLVEDAPIEISREDIDSARETFVDRVGEVLSSQQGSLSSAARLLVEIPTGGVLAVFLAFFMVKDGERFARWALGKVSRPRREMAAAAARRAWRAIGGFLAGAALLGFVESITIGIALWLVGGELIVPIMVLTFAAAFVPIIGAIVAGVVAVLVTLVTAGLAQAVIVALVALAVQQLDNDLLAPIVYGRMLSIHPVVILVGVVSGGALFGILGTLFAVPVLVVSIGVLDEVRRHLAPGAAPDRSGSEPA